MSTPELLQNAVGEFLAFAQDPERNSPGQYELVETRLDYLKHVTRNVERQLDGHVDGLRELQTWFRRETDPVILSSPLLKRTRTWPQGYPGDYLTLEMIYANVQSGDGIAADLDRYCLSRTLAVAVRSRLRMLTELLGERRLNESSGARWLNLACGPCRELLTLPDDHGDRTLYCVDTDPQALDYARALLGSKAIGRLVFLNENAFRFANPKRNVERFGQFTTIYSAGLFDYIASDKLSRLIAGLYDSLAPGGMLIAPFKDKFRYETFDYHWLAKWDFFFQRSEADFRRVLAEAGISDEAITLRRDESGVLLFFTIRK